LPIWLRVEEPYQVNEHILPNPELKLMHEVHAKHLMQLEVVPEAVDECVLKLDGEYRLPAIQSTM
jgi:hypothetical protein